MKDLDFAPYFMRAEVSTIQMLPETVGFATSEISSPGSILFTDDGALAGWGSSALNMERYLTIEGRRYRPAFSKVFTKIVVTSHTSKFINVYNSDQAIKPND